ncbi:hypothetical protein ASE14_08150 [Agromyces sp. Root81]|uniref:hypothetical protein n=1 Tax=Agromyces sp. Root81 TaxID=1736601 RepID=UPI0006F9769C|nr:hypothetical protein [Agromyces sp. Root81]KRC60922.1 hypothetical protein ASE14_08150 [Agromyces sp. Root81]
MISEHEYTATLLEGAGYELAPTGGKVGMDEGWAPHVQATLTIPVPVEAVQELIDAREARRIEISCTSTPHPLTPAPAQSRVFNLGLRGRKIGHRPGTIEITLASDEALVQDDVLLADTPNRDALAYQHSLRAMINAVILARIGAALEPGTVDTPFRVLSDATNPLKNPTGAAASPIAGYTTSSGGTGSIAGLAAQIPGVEHQGKVIRSTPNTATGGFWFNGNTGAATTYGPDTIPLAAGKKATIAVWVRASVAKTVALTAQTLTAANATVAAISGPATALAANVWTRLVLTFEQPATAAKYGFNVYNTAGSWAAGQTLDFGAIIPAEGDTAVDYFDGATVDTEEYAYAWTGAANASTSTRAALIDRSPQMLDWEPGESAWDFIQPIFQTAGLRLYCNEQRQWFLVDAGYIADGHTQLAVGLNTTEADDTISRDGSDWCDAALVVYRWNDQTDTPTVRYDWYAEPDHTRVRVVELRRAYTGTGFAKYIVKRAAGMGRQITASAVSQYQAQPGQPITITLPDTPIQTGLIASVEWRLDDDEMTVQSRGLTDTPPDAWIFGDPGISWLEIPVGMTWNTFDWSGI